MYILTLTNQEVTIAPKLSLEHDQLLAKELSYVPAAFEQQKAQAAKKGQAWRMGDGRIKLYRSKSNKFAAGFLQRVEDLFYAHNIAYTIDDQRILPVLQKTVRPAKLWKHQSEAIDVAMTEKRGMIEIPTGGGKSLVIAEVTKYFTDTCLITVPSILLLNQTIKDLELEYPNEKIGRVGDGDYDCQRITVGVINSLANAADDPAWQKWFGNLSCVLFDECHLAASDMYVKVAKALLRAAYRLGFSGTASREDGCELVLEMVTGPIIYNVPEMELVELKILCRPNITYIVDTQALACSKKTGSYATAYKEGIVENDRRNEIAVRLLHNHMQSNKGPGLILVKQINHGERVAAMYQDIYGEKIPFIYGESEKDLRLEVVESLKTLNIKGAIASTILDIGINIPPLDLLVFLGGEKQSSRLRQRIGRGTRAHPNKKEVLIYDFLDDYALYLKKHAQIREQVCQKVFTGCVGRLVIANINF